MRLNLRTVARKQLGFALAILGLLLIHPVKADTIRISSPEFPEAEAVTRVLKEAYGKIGHDIELVHRPAKRSLFEVNSGLSDAELVRVIGAANEFPNLVRVPEPVFALSISVVVNTNSKLSVRSWEELGKHDVVYPRGYKILDVRTQGMNAVLATDASAVAKLVKGGRVDVGLLITSDAFRLSSEIGGFVVLEPPLEVVTLYHFLNVKHRRLVPALEEILIEMNDSGRTQEILSRRD